MIAPFTMGNLCTRRLEYKRSKMPLDKEAKEYNMRNPRRGKVVIFNNDSPQNYRPGTEFDVEKLVETFRALGFKPNLHNDLSLEQVRSEIKKLSKQDFSDDDCLCVVVLTHGLAKNFVFASDGALYNIMELWSPFTDEKCPSLAGKPKVFIIQACRGDKLDSGTTLKKPLGTDTDTDNVESYTIPRHADFLLAYSTVEGLVSYRHPKKGSWFIQALCEELRQNAAKMDLLKLLTNVSRRVALYYMTENEGDTGSHRNKQVPSVVSTLIRDIHFTTNGDNSEQQDQNDTAGTLQLSEGGLQDTKDAPSAGHSASPAPNSPETPSPEEEGVACSNGMPTCRSVQSQRPEAAVSTNANDMIDMPSQWLTLEENASTSSAIMTVSKESEEYNMSCCQRRKAVIFNNGSEPDEHKLEQTYKSLGFETIKHNDDTIAGIESKTKELSKENFDGFACLCVTVLFYGADSRKRSALENLWTYFTADRCPSLAGKPKIFIIQAVRDENNDSDVDNAAKMSSETDRTTDAYKIPNYADFLLVYSTAKDCVAWRHAEKGSWFIQSLCEVLQSQASEIDLLKLLTNVSRKVALDHQSFDDELPQRNEQKQVPCVVSMLIRDVYLRPEN